MDFKTFYKEHGPKEAFISRPKRLERLQLHCFVMLERAVQEGCQICHGLEQAIRGKPV